MLKEEISSPRVEDSYALADYWEVLLLSSEDDEVGLADLQAILLKEADLDPALLDEVSVKKKKKKIDGRKAAGKKRRQRNVDLALENVRRHVRYRCKVVADSYPFVYDDNLDQLSLRDDLTSPQRLYIFLLLASCLFAVRKKPLDDLRSPVSVITDEFEVLTWRAVANMFKGWKVHIFGTTCGRDSGTPFVGTCLAKIKKLADVLGETFIGDETEFDDRDTGDFGLDVVAYYRFQDGGTGYALALAQCACTEEWDQKQNTVKFDHWAAVITLCVDPTPMVAVPHLFRSNKAGKWHEGRRIKRTVLLDRLRLLHLLADEAKRDGLNGMIGTEGEKVVELALSP